MIEERPDRSTEVVLAGRSNVGKSTLMRELTGHTFDTGRRPGVTQAANHFDWAGPDLVLTDLPGFGFMEGVPEERREEIKTAIVRYLEAFAAEIELAVLVLDGNSAVEIMERHTGPDSIPHDVELYGLLQDLGIPTVVAVNKIDKVDDRDDRLNAICEHLGLHPPWQQWQDRIAPISAKRGSIEPLRDAAEQQLRERGRDDVLQVFS